MSADRPCSGHLFDRRALLGALGAGMLVALDGCVTRRATPTARQRALERPRAAPARVAAVPPAPIPAPQPGRPRIVHKGPTGTRAVALTIDDGTCADCVAGYVAFAARTGIPITFSPNGRYREAWEPHSETLRPLIEAGQVQIANHTWSHRDPLRLTDSAVATDIERNEDWIQGTFGTTARPWFRPPYGRRSTRTDEIAGQLGYTEILLWNGTFGDSTPIGPAELMDLAGRYLKPGAIMLGHANQPTILGLLDQIRDLIAQRGLEPRTLAAMFS